MTGKRKGIRLGKMVVLAFAALSGSALAKPVMDDKQKCKAAIASYFELSGREVNARISVSEQRKSGDYLVTFKKCRQLTFSYLCRTSGNRIVWGDAQEKFGTMEMSYRLVESGGIDVSYVDDETMKKNTVSYQLSDL